MKITEQDIAALRSDRGGFSHAQVRKMKSLGYKAFNDMIGKDISSSDYSALASQRKGVKKKPKKPKPGKVINPMPRSTGGWEWKPQPDDIPQMKLARSSSLKARRAKVDQKKTAKQFLKSHEWRAVRYRVLERYDCKCMACGRSPKSHGVAIHVDHIKPRSTHPHLALEFDNLQLLCEDCNLGKSNKYRTDWRPDNG